MSEPLETSYDSPRGSGRDAADYPRVVDKEFRRSGGFLSTGVKIVAPLAVLAIAVGTFGYFMKTKPAPVVKPPSERVWNVVTKPVALESVRPQMRVFGKVFAGREVELRPLVAGQIVEVGPNFAEGGIVQKGELLVQVDPFDYQTFLDEAKAQRAEAAARLREIRAELTGATGMLANDEEQLKLRQRDLDRREKLSGKGASSIKNLDDAKMALSEMEQRLIDRKRQIDSLQARVSQQQATINRLDVSVRRAARDLDQARLTAPFNGFLVNADAEEGKRVGVGDRVARLIDADRLEVRFNVSNTQFAELIADGGYEGRAANVYWQGSDGGKPFKAVIQRSGSEIQTASGGVELYAQLTETGSDTRLRPGAFVRVELPGRQYENIVRVPERALYGGDTVYVMKDGRSRAVTVEVAAKVGTDVLVTGALEPGMALITTRFPEMGPGVKVTAQ